MLFCEDGDDDTDDDGNDHGITALVEFWPWWLSPALVPGKNIIWLGGTVQYLMFTQTREEQYTPSSLEFSKASPGVGAVLRAIAEAGKLQKNHSWVIKKTWVQNKYAKAATGFVQCSSQCSVFNMTIWRSRLVDGPTQLICTPDLYLLTYPNIKDIAG